MSFNFRKDILNPLIHDALWSMRGGLDIKDPASRLAALVSMRARVQKELQGAGHRQWLRNANTTLALLLGGSGIAVGGALLAAGAAGFGWPLAFFGVAVAYSGIIPAARSASNFLNVIGDTVAIEGKLDDEISSVVKEHSDLASTPEYKSLRGNFHPAADGGKAFAELLQRVGPDPRDHIYAPKQKASA